MMLTDWSILRMGLVKCIFSCRPFIQIWQHFPSIVGLSFRAGKFSLIMPAFRSGKLSLLLQTFHSGLAKGTFTEGLSFRFNHWGPFIEALWDFHSNSAKIVLHALHYILVTAPCIALQHSETRRGRRREHCTTPHRRVCRLLAPPLRCMNWFVGKDIRGLSTGSESPASKADTTTEMTN
jgi:hypothetical protein